MLATSGRVDAFEEDKQGKDRHARVGEEVEHDGLDDAHAPRERVKERDEEQREAVGEDRSPSRASPRSSTKPESIAPHTFAASHMASKERKRSARISIIR
jgi:hypothetical protein